MQRHFPDVLHHTVNHHHAVLVSLYHAHVTAGKVGQQYTESNRYKQQRLVLLLDSQIQQNKRNGIHDEEPRIGNNVAERSHII